jgi:outer membrane protein insertion porin family
MHKLPIVALALLGAATSLAAQASAGQAGPCATPDSIGVSGNKRVSAQTILTDAGLTAGMTLNSPVVQRAIKNVFQSGQFDGVDIHCRLTETTPPKAIIVIEVVERPILEQVDVAGAKNVPPHTVKDLVDLLIGRPVNPSQVAHVVQRIDSLYQSQGYVLATIKPETTFTADKDRASILFRIDEGSRLAISGIRVQGNKFVSSGDIVGVMKTKPEGFLWFNKGEFDRDKYAQDVGEKIPELYSNRGFIDFQLMKDTLVVNRERGKALVDLQVNEGQQYKLGSFEVVGNKRFSSEYIKRYYPFTDQSPTLPQRLKGLVMRKPIAKDVFDASKWEDGSRKVREAMANEGYIYAHMNNPVDRVQTDSGPRVNLRWDISEGTPAIINRIEILGNDYTNENCIRDQLVLIPGDVFSQERLIRSYLSIGNLGFFETPIPFPETRQANDQGDIDLVFKVKEKRTGNVNFGASMGQGTGLGGFIGLDQPNLFGTCKRGALNYQFGRYINDFSLTYTDPSIRGGWLSGSATLYRSQSRYTIADLGQTTRTGGQVRLGVPIFNSRATRLAFSYGAEAIRYGGDGLVGTITTNNCAGCVRSTLGVDLTRDTRIGVPFPFEGNLQTITSQFNGGPLGGTATFQRYTTEFKTFTTVWTIGGKSPGSDPLRLVAGLSQRAGMVFGNAGPFFSSQEFALGGVQYGEPLRGYNEFSITPLGYNPSTSTSNAVRASFGNAFFVTTAELGLRISSQLYTDLFFEGGNIWNRPRDFNPTRLFRGAGIGVSTITPLGPLGLDWAYGMDRVDLNGRPDPKWQLHFRLGQLFN